MNANRTATTANSLLDDFPADLTEAAYQVAGEHGVAGSSVDVELDLWKALGAVVRKTGRPTRYQFDREALLADLTDAAYQVALRNGTEGAFIDLELDLWRALDKVVGRAKYAGLVAKLLHNPGQEQFPEPWRKESKTGSRIPQFQYAC
jgi:hypothetical protein